ncbi:RIP metalloprotease RseP [Thioalkalivibrio sp. HK1]|uniref:RIP metalloprotease RseP n=1 Tax=Thioalkalivibrio sp. HK1 TaxID=1469245 RepID=UPI00046F23B4|nr:RIP metalloprotease RseP [Thioalkalivibrio sp. HK1]
MIMDFIDWMSEPLYAVAGFVIAIGVLVAVHEFGHYWVARRCGIKVLKFSIGFGRPIVHYRAGRDRTEYALSAIPLGGYVRMLDEHEGEVDESERHRAFNRKPLIARAAVIAAGPAFNFLFAIVALACVQFIGVEGLRPLVGGVEPDSAAAKAGFRPGDALLSVEGEPTALWQSALPMIVASSLEKREIDIEVVDDADRLHRRTIDLEGIAPDDLAGRSILEHLGIEPEWVPLPAVIAEVVAASPASRSGLRAGDRVIEAAGEDIEYWGDLVRAIRSRPEQEVPLVVRRDQGQTITLTVVPEAIEYEQERFGRIGVIPSRTLPPEVREKYFFTERKGFTQALIGGIDETGDIIMLTLRVMGKMISGDISPRHINGPIGIADYAGDFVRSGLSQFLGFMAVISIGLGIINLLPIPILDGGHLLFCVIETFRRRPLSRKVHIAANGIGMAFIAGLMSLAFYNDLSRLFG